MTYEGPAREDMMAGRPTISGILHGFSTNTGMVAVVVSLVGASLAGVAIAQVGASMAVIVVFGALVFVVLLAFLLRLGIKSITTYSSSTVVRFPSDSAARRWTATALPRARRRAGRADRRGRESRRKSVVEPSGSGA